MVDNDRDSTHRTVDIEIDMNAMVALDTDFTQDTHVDIDNDTGDTYTMVTIVRDSTQDTVDTDRCYAGCMVDGPPPILLQLTMTQVILKLRFTTIQTQSGILLTMTQILRRLWLLSLQNPPMMLLTIAQVLRRLKLSSLQTPIMILLTMPQVICRIRLTTIQSKFWILLTMTQVLLRLWLPLLQTPLMILLTMTKVICRHKVDNHTE